MNFVFVLSVFLTAALANSESEQWSWPTSGKDRTQADSRKDIYFENINSSEQSGRIRVPTSYYDRRPLQSYQVKEPTTNRPKPLSDEFSNEFTSSGENYSNNVNGYGGGNRFPQGGTANRFRPQQANDYPQQFGPFGGGGGFPGGPAQFPGQQAYPYQGQFQGGRFPIGGAGSLGFPGGNNIANGILVGPGGPTGIIGRPYGGYPQQPFGGGFGNHLGGGGGGFGQYPGGGGGFGFGPQGGFGGFDGHQNGIGPQGGFGNSPYGPQFGGHGSGGFPGGPLFDSTGHKNSNVKKIEKSAK